MNEKLNSFKEIITYLNSLENEEDLQKFIMTRLEELENNSDIKTISRNTDFKLIGSITKGYINSDSKIVTSNLVEPFYMNDLNLYLEFAKFIKGKDLSNPVKLFHVLQNYINYLFGVKGNQDKRLNLYLGHENGEDISIADFYFNDTALCSERSAAVQNLLSFCGIKSYLIFGELTSQNQTEDHAYNILELKTNLNENILVLFDVTNPVSLEKGIVPAFTIINNEDISEVLNINFDFNNLVEIYGQNIHPDEPQDRNYITCNYYLHKSRTQ